MNKETERYIEWEREGDREGKRTRGEREREKERDAVRRGGDAGKGVMMARRGRERG